MVEMLGHVSKSPSCLLKLKVNGFICHPFIVFKNMKRHVILVLVFIFILFIYLFIYLF
jgi:hypothetical protein